MCLVDNSLCSSNKVATEHNVEKELYDLEEQIASLEALNCSSNDIVKVLEELKICYANLKLFQKNNVCEAEESVTCETDLKNTLLEWDSSDTGSCMVLSSDDSLDTLSSDASSKCPNPSCLQSYEETCDGLLLTLILKAWEVMRALHTLELQLSQFVWGAYFYEHLKAGQLVVCCDFQLNGTPFWNVAQVLEIYVDCYNTVDVEAFLRAITCHTFLDFRTLKRVETISCDMPSLKDVSNKFYVISKVKVDLFTPRCLAETMCDNIEQCSIQHCSYHHGRLIEPQNIRTFLLDSVMQKGRHVVVKRNATNIVWKEGTITKVTKECVHVQEANNVLQINYKTSCRVLPDLILEPFKASELPNVFHHIQEMCETKCPEQENKEKITMKKQCVTMEKRMISSNDTFGEWEKYTKGFGSRMLMRMGYKIGEALSPPSWKPCHRPKLIEPLSVCVLRPRAGLKCMKDTIRNNVTTIKTKKRLKTKSQEGEASTWRALRLINKTFVGETKYLKKKKSQGQYNVCDKSDAVLRQELIDFKDKELRLQNEIHSLRKHVERHQKTQVENKLTVMYTRKLNEKEKELLHLQNVYGLIEKQLQLNQSSIALQSF